MLFEQIVNQSPICKGWSADQKFLVTLKDGSKHLLRISPLERKSHLEGLFSMLYSLQTLNLPMCHLEESGVCKEGIYSIYTWIEGSEASEIIPYLPEARQYELGIKAGEFLKKIHSIPAPRTHEDWLIRFSQKTDRKIQKYRECGVRFEDDNVVIDYLTNHRDCLQNRPQTFQHGDYHIGNMMMSHNELFIIDFDRFDFGDPWEDFNRIVWCAQAAPCFASGMVDGYFDLNPPYAFWECLAFYIGSNMLSSIYWALSFDEKELSIMIKQNQDVLSWFHQFKKKVPTWYLRPTV